MFIHKNFFLFFFLFFLIFPIVFSLYTSYNGEISLIRNPNKHFNFSTDFSLTALADVYKTSNTKVFLPMGGQQKIQQNEVYICPGNLEIKDFHSSAKFHISKFSLNGPYYQPIQEPVNDRYVDRFACDCYTSVSSCNSNNCNWRDIEVSPPFGINFISSNFLNGLKGITNGVIPADPKNQTFTKFNAKFSQVFGYKKEVAEKFYPFLGPNNWYPNHRTYATLLLEGTQSILVSSSSTTKHTFPFIKDSTYDLADEQSEKFATTLNFVNNKKDTFFKGVEYKGQIYTVSLEVSPLSYNNILPAYFPPPIDNKNFSKIYLFTPYQSDTKVSFSQNSQELLKVYVVEPNDCSEVDILDVSPNPLKNLALNTPITLTITVSTPYELFGLKAKSIKMTSPQSWKIEKQEGFDTPFSSSVAHTLKAKLTPTTVIAKKSKVCFEIEFETDTEFCDGKLCSTKKEACLDYEPLFYCILSAKPSPPLKSGGYTNIIANCYLDNNPTACPDLTWTASGFNKPPSKIERISLVTPPYPMIEKPKAFVAIENNNIQNINPKVVHTTKRPPFPIPGYTQSVTLFTYSDQEASAFGLGSGTPKTSRGKIVAGGVTEDNEKFECTLLLSVEESNLPDLVPILIFEGIEFNKNSLFPTLKFKWGIKNQMVGGGADVTIPFSSSIYFFDQNSNNFVRVGKSINLNSLKNGETYWVGTVEYACSNPILTLFKVIVDENNNVKERDELNNEEVSFGNCLFKLTCPGFI
ncbi:MAG: hypothetical protein NC918_00780 [Candidatus Omnitrophica bacterium]|nr:hypothetical protein [Candidatus Omnitrophota bacterium]